ncbi:ribonuclease T2-like [Dissophora globulifera]|uniref:ribonuclease T2 n=1 Tax=Dissophora globulifera TaxID=979702 RepID=A0A9P6UIU4_9FUNG|nr:ribonuclease T2-like [Dissophora globulifera]
MKLDTISTFLVMAAVSVVSALPLQNSALNPHATCPANILSCSLGADNVDSCCLPTYGLVVLSQQWYSGLGPREEFTMHGLWPDTCSGDQGPWNGCDPGRIYDDVEMRLQKYLQDDPGTSSAFFKNMTTYWSSYNDDNNKFWSHEWSKHGTCVSTIEPQCFSPKVPNKDVYTYFSSALALRSQHNIYQALAAKKIYPGSNPTVSSMQDAIEAQFGVKAEINCTCGVLSEIMLYFHVKNADQYEIIAPHSHGDCPDIISYPVKSGSLSPPPHCHKRTTPPTTTSPSGSIPSGRQTGPCTTTGAMVCVDPGISNQYSKCNQGLWVLNQCRSGLLCYSDTTTAAHCA